MAASRSNTMQQDHAAASAQPVAGIAERKRTQGRRLEFLDAVRAVAALMVLAEHSLEAAGIISIAHGGFGVGVLDLGQVGVMAFFLVSGFIIPVSLERKSSLSSFWISRVFRLYPMYISAWIFGALVIFQLSGLGYLQNLIYHIAFIQEIAVKLPQNIVPGSWTLGMEIIWYFVFSILFLIRLNGATGRIVLTAVAAVFVLLGVSIVTHRSLPFGRAGLFLGFLAGLTVYRHHLGALSYLKAFGLVTLIAATSIIAAYVRFQYLVSPGRDLEFSAAAIVASWGLGYTVFLTAYFAGSRFHSVFAVLGTLGKISYSLYLCHPFFILLGKALHIQGLELLAFVLVTSLVSSVLTYRYIEQPFVRLGHRIGSLSAARS